MSLLTDADIHYFHEGTHLRLWHSFGAHFLNQGDHSGTNFVLWAPNARAVSVFGEYNNWNKQANLLVLHGQSGIWETFVPGTRPGARYKYYIQSSDGSYKVDKADPFGFTHIQPPDNSSVVCDLSYEWGDQVWMSSRAAGNSLAAPISIYEVHPGSWRRIAED